MSNSTSYDGLLKDVYLPTLTETVFNDAKFTAQIQQTTSNIDYEGQRVRHAWGTQNSAGIQAHGEGGDYAKPVPVKGKQGWEQLKYFTSYLELTGPVIKAARSSRGTYSPAVARHFKTNILAQKNFFERMLMGNGDGKLAVWSDADVTGTGESTAYDVTGDAFFDTQFIEPGIYIEVRNPTFNTPTLRTAIDGTNAYATVFGITKGDKAAGTRGTMTLTESMSANVAQNDWICRYGAYSSGGTFQEMNGIGSLVTDGSSNSETTNNFLYTWPSGNTSGLARTSYTYLTSYMKDFADAQLDEESLIDALLYMEFQYQASPKMLLVDPLAMKYYFTNVKDDRRFNTMSAMNWTGGYTGLGIQLGSRQLMLTDLGSMQRGYIFMIDPADFAFATMSNGWEWVLGDSGNVLVQSHTADKKFAAAENYMQFVCYDPQKQMKGYSVATS